MNDPAGWTRIAEPEKRLAAVRALIPKWREDRAGYPLNDPLASAAFIAVRMCSEELEAVLSESVG